MKKIILLSLCLFLLTNSISYGSIITFEITTDPIQSGILSITPANVYSEKGFKISPSNDLSSVFDFEFFNVFTPVEMRANNSDWFGFEESNKITVDANNTLFNLTSLDVGITTLASSSSIDLMITGSFINDIQESKTLNNVSDTITWEINWSNLISFTIMSSDDAGIDNLVLSQVPIPSALWLFVSSLIGLWISAKNNA